MNKGVSFALVGASGVVGTKIIQLMEKRDFPIDEFIPLGNSTVGSLIQFNNKQYQVESLENFIIMDDKGKNYTITEFLDVIEKLKIKKA